MSNSKKKKMPKSSMETFFKVLRMIGNYRFLLILSIVLAAVTVVLQLYVPILFGNAIDEVIGAHAVDFERMWYYLSRILVMVIVSSVSTWISTAPETSSAVSLPTPISFPMVFSLALPSCFPVS